MIVEIIAYTETNPEIIINIHAGSALAIHFGIIWMPLTPGSPKRTRQAPPTIRNLPRYWKKV